MSRMIMHIDMDAFFAAVEQRDNPELRGKPVIIGALPGRRGVVSTASYEARKFGVGSAMPVSEAYRRCPHGIFIKPSRKYGDESRRIMALLQDISPLVEPVSVDEAYLDITGLERLYGPPEAIGELVRKRIFEHTRLTASVGIGPNRLIAKLASDFKKPDGLTVVMPDMVQAFLDPLPVSRLRGVGGKQVDRLHRQGLRTVAQLRRWPIERLVEVFGEAGGHTLYRQSRGIGSDVVGGSRERKSISKEHTYNEDVGDIKTLRDTLRTLAEDVARSARKKQLSGRGVRVKIRLSGFETHTISQTMKRSTNLAETLFETGWALYQNSPYTGRPVRLIGIGLFDWDAETQLDLFARPDARKQKLAETLDTIVARFGKDAIGLNKKRG